MNNRRMPSDMQRVNTHGVPPNIKVDNFRTALDTRLFSEKRKNEEIEEMTWSI
jgi:hypothetical protein